MPVLDVSDHELDMIIASVLLKSDGLFTEIRKFNSRTKKKGNGRVGRAGDMIAHYEQKQREYNGLVGKLRTLHNRR